MTNDGRPVLPLRGGGADGAGPRERKPFEPIMIGHCDPSGPLPPPPAKPLSGQPEMAAAAAGSVPPAGQEEEEREYWPAAGDPAAATAAGATWQVPLHRVIVSVPTGHSAKPPLDGLIAACRRRTPDRRADSGHATAAGAESVGGAAGAAGAAEGELFGRQLELFGRAARSGWTVAGDQVLEGNRLERFVLRAQPTAGSATSAAQRV